MDQNNQSQEQVASDLTATLQGIQMQLDDLYKLGNSLVSQVASLQTGGKSTKMIQDIKAPVTSRSASFEMAPFKNELEDLAQPEKGFVASIVSFFSGKKTYIVAILIALYNVAYQYETKGQLDPVFTTNALLAAAGLGSMRLAINKAQKTNV